MDPETGQNEPTEARDKDPVKNINKETRGRRESHGGTICTGTLNLLVQG